MKYKEGDKVKCILEAFNNVFGEDNIWIVDGIRTQNKGYPTLYLCHRENDRVKTIYFFKESELTSV